MSSLPKVIDANAFITNAYNIYIRDKKLQECSFNSFVNALMDAAKVGLMPNTPLRHCALIPYVVKGIMTANFQMEYRGHVELALRTGLYESIYAHEVYPQDEFKACYGLHKDLIHVPSKDPIPEGAMPIYYYAVYKLKNGGYDFVYWTRDRVLKHRDKYSKSYISAKGYGKEKDNRWVTEEVAMGLKTMIIRVLNTAPKSVEMVRALSTEPEGEYLKEYFPNESNEENPLNGMSDVITMGEGEIVDKQAGEVKEEVKPEVKEAKKEAPIGSMEKFFEKSTERKKKREMEDEITDKDLGITSKQSGVDS